MANAQAAAPGVIPHLTIADGKAADAVAFYTRAFGATEASRHMADDGKRIMHAHLDINGGALMLNDEFPEFKSAPPTPPGSVILHVEVRDADAAWNRALDAGATVHFPIADQFWGARYGQVEDPFGFIWSLASPLAAPAD